MALFVLLACSPPAPAEDTADTPGDTAADTASIAAPAGGAFVVEVAEEWSGDCEFTDPATGEAPEQEWTLDPDGERMVLYPDFWAVLTCTLAGVEFDCDDGSWSTARIDVSRRVQGSFSGADGLDGGLVVALDCKKDGCDELQGAYGRRLEFPCTATAPFSGVRR